MIVSDIRIIERCDVTYWNVRKQYLYKTSPVTGSVLMNHVIRNGSVALTPHIMVTSSLSVIFVFNGRLPSINVG